MKCIGDKCDLLEEDGKVVDMETDERGDFHFNALLDAVADWRKQTNIDCSLGGEKIVYARLVRCRGFEPPTTPSTSLYEETRIPGENQEGRT